jgi:hypothetical protein
MDCLQIEEIKYFNLKSPTKAGWKDFSTRKTKDDFGEAQGSYVKAAKAGTTFVVQMNLDNFLRLGAVQGDLGLPSCKGLQSFHGLG